MNVLSLFDGMSCGQLALQRAGISVDNYFASEIDKYAITVTQANYPNTIQLGDITKWREWELPHIDLIIGGSPCQGFSFAGKQLAFNDTRSALFFEFIDTLKHYKPKYFLLENVRMKKEYLDEITRLTGVEPIHINSSLVSAQNRVRYYWTNIPSVTQPSDKGIILSDVLEQGVVDRDKSFCIDANYYKGGNLKSYYEKHRRQLVFAGLADDIKGHQSRRRVYRDTGKAATLLAASRGCSEPKVAINEKHYRKLTPLECERLQTVPDNYTNHVSNTQRYRMLGNGWTVDVISHIFKNILDKPCRGAILKV